MRILNYEICKEISKKYSSRYELEKGDRSVYKKISKNKWYELFSHMKTKKLTYEKCKETALKFNTRGELSKIEGATHRKILLNGWYELLEHMIKVGSLKKRMIYLYEFSDGHFYVGLTFNIYKRNLNHFSKKSNSSVLKHSIKTKLIPKLIHISDYIDIEDAIKLEELTLKSYVNNGWVALNKTKTGGTGYTNIFWTYEKCKEEALKYNNRITMKEKSPVLYKTIYSNKWNNELLSHMELLHKKWTYDEIILVSKRYCKISHFKNDYPGAYQVAKREKWLDDVKKHMDMPIEKWTYKKCKEEALKYKHRCDFMLNSSGAFQASKREKWYNDICSHMIRKIRENKHKI